MAEDQILFTIVALFIAALVGFLIAWLLRDKETARLRRDLFQARCIAQTANNELLKAYHAQIQTVDRITVQTHATMIAIRQIRQWIDTVNPTIPVKSDRYDVTQIQIAA